MIPDLLRTIAHLARRAALPMLAFLVLSAGVAQAQDFQRIENRWKKTYIHNQNGPVEVGAIKPNWFSAMWAVEPVPNTGYVRIKNRWSKTYLHNQNGPLELGTIQPGWWSAM